MLNFLIDNIFVKFGGLVFQQIIGIPMGTNCAPLLADLFLYSYESEFIQNLQKNGSKKQCASFNLTYRYIDDVLSINNSKFSEYLDITMQYIHLNLKLKTQMIHLDLSIF